MRHYLDEETGDLPDGLPTPVLNLALFFGSIVAWVTDHLPHGDWHTNVPREAAITYWLTNHLERAADHAEEMVMASRRPSRARAEELLQLLRRDRAHAVDAPCATRNRSSCGWIWLDLWLAKSYRKFWDSFPNFRCASTN